MRLPSHDSINKLVNSYRKYLITNTSLNDDEIELILIDYRREMQEWVKKRKNYLKQYKHSRK